MPVPVVKSICDWYCNQSVKVRWAGRVSEPFNVSNGVRQGGVLSPFLFNACIDGLLGILRDSGFGARLSGYDVGCITYADDITLISPTVHGLQSMPSICERFVKGNMLKFRSGLEPHSSIS